MFFAWQAGEKGRVFSFEVEPGNLDIMKHNLDLNPDLVRRVDIVPKALWAESNAVLSFSSNGPGTQVGAARDARGGPRVTTVTLDDFARDLPKVDFIKMDIEGAELRALQGSAAVIRKHRPKLAIALYHHLDDFVTIPRFLTSLNLEYRYFLGHPAIHAEEMVLFAAPPRPLRHP